MIAQNLAIPYILKVFGMYQNRQYSNQKGGQISKKRYFIIILKMIHTNVQKNNIPHFGLACHKHDHS